MNKATLAQIKELKADINSVHRFTEGNDQYGIYIIARGELLFFQQNDAAFLCDISARDALIIPDTIKSWDNGKKITAEEKPALLETIIRLYKQAYKDDLTIFSEK